MDHRHVSHDWYDHPDTHYPTNATEVLRKILEERPDLNKSSKEEGVLIPLGNDPVYLPRILSRFWLEAKDGSAALRVALKAP